MDAPSLRADLERLHDASFAWALVCCAQHRADAEDVLQQSYVKLLEGRARFDGRSQLKTFLFGVIKRTALELRRRDRVRDALSGKLLVDAVIRLWTASSEAQVDDKRESERIRRALATLSDRQRDVLELVAYHGLTVDDAARVLSISVGSARTHYDRGKTNLAHALRGAR